MRDTDRVHESKCRTQAEHRNEQLIGTHRGTHHVRINSAQRYAEREVNACVQLARAHTQSAQNEYHKGDRQGAGITAQDARETTEYTTHRDTREHTGTHSRDSSVGTPGHLIRSSNHAADNQCEVNDVTCSQSKQHARRYKHAKHSSKIAGRAMEDA